MSQGTKRDLRFRDEMQTHILARSLYIDTTIRIYIYMSLLYIYNSDAIIYKAKVLYNSAHVGF